MKSGPTKALDHDVQVEPDSLSTESRSDGRLSHSPEVIATRANIAAARRNARGRRDPGPQCRPGPIAAARLGADLPRH